MEWFEGDLIGRALLSYEGKYYAVMENTLDLEIYEGSDETANYVYYPYVLMGINLRGMYFEGLAMSEEEIVERYGMQEIVEVTEVFQRLFGKIVRG